MTILGAGLRALGSICREFASRFHSFHPSAKEGSKHKRRGKRRFVYFRVIRSQLENERRALQEELDRAQNSLDETLTLIDEAQATRVRVHIGARLSLMKARTRISTQKAG